MAPFQPFANPMLQFLRRLVADADDLPPNPPARPFDRCGAALPKVMCAPSLVSRWVPRIGDLRCIKFDILDSTGECVMRVGDGSGREWRFRGKDARWVHYPGCAIAGSEWGIPEAEVVERLRSIWHDRFGAANERQLATVRA